MLGARVQAVNAQPPAAIIILLNRDALQIWLERFEQPARVKPIGSGDSPALTRKSCVYLAVEPASTPIGSRGLGTSTAIFRFSYLASSRWNQESQCRQAN